MKNLSKLSFVIAALSAQAFCVQTTPEASLIPVLFQQCEVNFFCDDEEGGLEERRPCYLPTHPPGYKDSYINDEEYTDPNSWPAKLDEPFFDELTN